tara:strand:+ start:1224 stop:1871 length:648 start_codon:yes stop_codon:yes gene_type:complete
MDQDIEIINNETRRERIINFIVKNKKRIVSIGAILILILLSFFSYQAYIESHKEGLANKYNSATSNYQIGDKLKVETIMKQIINEKDKTYSPLALYFLIDNNLISSVEEANNYFDIIINEVKLEKEIKFLNIYKKALFNSDTENENELLEIINPLLKSESTWKSHGLYLMGEYFYANGQKQKAIDFYNQILNLEKGNNNIKLEAQKRLSRDLGEK